MKIIVGVADMKTSNEPGDTIITYSLGSCIGLVIYDPVARAGGILHYMLPDSSIDGVKAKTKPYMFADTGIPRLFKQAYTLGAKKKPDQGLYCRRGGNPGPERNFSTSAAATIWP